jgi:hypothetical protein
MSSVNFMKHHKFIAYSNIVSMKKCSEKDLGEGAHDSEGRVLHLSISF